MAPKQAPCWGRVTISTGHEALQWLIPEKKEAVPSRSLQPLAPPKRKTNKHKQQQICKKTNKQKNATPPRPKPKCKSISQAATGKNEGYPGTLGASTGPGSRNWLDRHPVHSELFPVSAFESLLTWGQAMHLHITHIYITIYSMYVCIQINM